MLVFVIMAMVVVVSQSYTTSHHRIDIGNNITMPVLTLGTGGWNDTLAEDAVVLALKSGFDAVHAAFDYFNLKGVGRGIAQSGRRRADIFVTAMTSPCFHNTSKPYRNVTDPLKCQALTEKEVDMTLQELGLEYADLMLLHGPNEPFGFIGTCDAKANELNLAQWKAYENKLRQGRTRAIGVSNYCPSCLDAFQNEDIQPVVNQIQLHVGMGEDPEGLLRYCEKHSIVVQAYSPLAAGGVVSDPLCSSVGAKYNKTAAEVGLRWIVRRENVAVVVKASSHVYMAQDLGVFDWDLSDKDVDRLNQATTPKGQQDGRPSWGCTA